METGREEMSSVEDPLLKELLTALKQDTQRMASDLLSVITTQALIAVFALFLAIASLVRLIIVAEFPVRFGAGPGIGTLSTFFETVLTFILFALSVVSIYNLIQLRIRYTRLQILAERLGR